MENLEKNEKDKRPQKEKLIKKKEISFLFANESSLKFNSSLKVKMHSPFISCINKKLYNLIKYI